jgi:hypothetical protein
MIDTQIANIFIEESKDMKMFQHKITQKQHVIYTQEKEPKNFT